MQLLPDDEGFAGDGGDAPFVLGALARWLRLSSSLDYGALGLEGPAALLGGPEEAEPCSVLFRFALAVVETKVLRDLQAAVAELWGDGAGASATMMWKKGVAVENLRHRLRGHGWTGPAELGSDLRPVLIALAAEVLGDLAGAEWARGASRQAGPAQSGSILRMAAQLAASFGLADPAAYVAPEALQGSDALANLCLLRTLLCALAEKRRAPERAGAEAEGAEEEEEEECEPPRSPSQAPSPAGKGWLAQRGDGRWVVDIHSPGRAGLHLI